MNADERRCPITRSRGEEQKTIHETLGLYPRSMMIAGRCLLAVALSTAFLAGAILPSPIASASDADAGDGEYRLSETGSTPPGGQAEHSYAPESGFVPDPATAIRIAEAVLIPIYGEDNIARERPFVASLDGDVWHVRGSLTSSPGIAVVGGVAEIEIAKQDGRIIRVTHGR